ncbi:MAG TPA: hypothetical protein DCS89_01800 [Gammaproteobacteria bacterium]|nr:hypothetical protein [Gammaproteobacteria bacterium]
MVRDDLCIRHSVSIARRRGYCRSEWR